MTAPTLELRREKAVQHIMVFAQFASHEFCNRHLTVSELLCIAASRAYRAEQLAKQPGESIEWTANTFGQHMREVLIEHDPVIQAT